MGRYLRALWYMVTGRFSAAADALQSNKHVMTATFDRAISQHAERFETVKRAVAQFMALETTRVQEIKTLNRDVDDLEKKRSGAQVAMQRRINELRTQSKSKEEIESDAEFIKHRAAYTSMDSTIKKKEETLKEKEADLAEKQDQIAKFKAELQGMQRQHEQLKEEKQETLADVAISQQAEAINNVLTGISQDTTEQDLIAVREERKAAKARAKITAEIAGNDAKLAENEYLQYASEAEANSDLDAVLDWGDEDKGTLENAKIPE